MLNEALRISRETADRSGEADATKFLAKIYLDTGETDRSHKLLGQALEIYRATEDKQNIAATLLLLAKANAKDGDLESAQSHAHEAISQIEAVRTSVKPSDLRDSFTANLQDFYSFYIEILMLRHEREPNGKFAELAFQSSERARARGLLNLLNESHANVREGVDPTLLAKETWLKNLLSARMENLTRNLGGRIADEQSDKLKRETEQIRAEYEQIQAQIRQTSPRYAALTQPEIPDIQEIQKDLLDSDTVLLEYSLGEKKSFLWIVTKTDFHAFTLPAKSVIENLTRSFYESLTAREQHVRFETVDERDERIRQADSEMERSSQELSSMLLAPAARQLADKRLLIVADGVLQYIPFSALTMADGQSAAKKRFLVETNEVVNLPSASVLSLLRNETTGRAAAPETVAIFADPIFDAEDTRLITASRRTKLHPGR